MKQWRVEFDGGEEQVKADAIEITASGVLVFYTFVSRMEKERTLVTAFSPSLWRRCQLDSAD